MGRADAWLILQGGEKGQTQRSKEELKRRRKRNKGGKKLKAHFWII
jgi:hypothetical protein